MIHVLRRSCIEREKLKKVELPEHEFRWLSAHLIAA